MTGLYTAQIPGPRYTAGAPGDHFRTHLDGATGLSVTYQAGWRKGRGPGT